MPQDRASRVRRLIAELGVKQGDIAEKTGVSQSTLSEILSGKRSVTEDVAQKLGPALGVSPLYILYGASVRTEVMDGVEFQVAAIPAVGEETVGPGGGEYLARGSRIPVVRRASADPQSRIEWEPVEPPEWIEIPRGCEAAEVRGDSMAPVVLDGQRVVYEPGRWPGDGDLALVILRDGRQLLKRWWEQGGKVTLQSVGYIDPRLPQRPEADIVVAKSQVRWAAWVFLVDLRRSR